MKRLLMILFIVGGLLIPSIAFTFQNEPDNFRGIKWGTNLSDLPDMRLQITKTGGNLKMYLRRGDKMKIGDAELTVIIYVFYKDRFVSVMISFESASNFEAIKKTLFSVYGKGRQDNPFIEEYKWMGADVRILLEKGFLKGQVLYSYMPILKDYLEEKKKGAEEGAKDL